MRAWQIAVIGIMAVVLILTSLIMVWQRQPSISDEILRIKVSIEGSAKAVKAGNFNEAETYLSDVRSSLSNANKLLAEKGDELKDEVENYRFALQIHEDIYKILSKLHFLSKEANTLLYAVENVASSEASFLLPRMEVVERGLVESEMYLKTTIWKLDVILGLNPDISKYGLSDEFAIKVKDLTPWFLDFRLNFQRRFAAALSMFPNYYDLKSREVPAIGKISPFRLDANVLRFFNALDEDESKTLDLEELQNIFYWSKCKIDYRPSGKENQIMKILADPNYWETTSQMRIDIIANDKDISELYATFLNHYRADAYVASLLSNSKKSEDHFICIVRISETFKEFNEKVGNMHFFKVNGDDFGISSGYFMILDPLSDVPFYLVRGENPSEYSIGKIFLPPSPY